MGGAFRGDDCIVFLHTLKWMHAQLLFIEQHQPLMYDYHLLF